MRDGRRLDIAVGLLGPDVSDSTAGMPEVASLADSFLMPAFGWVSKSGRRAYGIGVFAQGGMGTEFSASSFLALGSGDLVRSELGVGRVILPFVCDLTDDFSIGASLDFVWASLDLKMAATGAQMGGMVTGFTGANTGPALQGLGGAPWVRIDYSNGGEFKGAACGTGFAGKIGFSYRYSPRLIFGAAYHSKTSLSDLETEASDALTLRAGANLTGNPIPDLYLNPMFPAIVKTHYTLGFGYRASTKTSYDFSVTFAPDAEAAAGPDPVNGTTVNVSHGLTNIQAMISYRY